MSDAHETQTDQPGQPGMNFELVTEPSPTAVIKVIGVGGGGGNAVARMVSEGAMEGVEFIAVNTDVQALDGLRAKLGEHTTLQIGKATTKGLGAGARPAVGQQAAQEDKETIQHVLDGADMVFITAGMGGGTGTGAAPVVAQIAKGLDILTVAVVTKPFFYEGRDTEAAEGIAELSNHVDSLITVPNDKLPDVYGGKIRVGESFVAADNVLRGAVQGIADIIIQRGVVNVDFADVRTVMSERGLAIMGTGQASGEDRARQATEEAINSPLLDDVDMRGARGVVVNVTTADTLVLDDLQVIGTTIRDLAAKDATIVIGTANEDDMGEDLRVTVVATGLGEPAVPEVVVDNSRAPQRAGRTAGYDELDEPTVIRRRAAAADLTGDPDYLDVPKFLQRQAD